MGVEAPRRPVGLSFHLDVGSRGGDLQGNIDARRAARRDGKIVDDCDFKTW